MFMKMEKQTQDIFFDVSHITEEMDSPLFEANWCDFV